MRNHTHIEKIRIAKFVTQTINSNDPKITDHNGMMNTVLSLLAKGDMNCAGSEIKADLFGTGEPRPTTTTGTLHTTPRTPNETSGTGVVLTAAEKQKAEEEARCINRVIS